MRRLATSANLSRLAWCMVCLTAAAGAGHAQGVRAGTSVTLTAGAPSRVVAGPPVSLGQRVVGSAGRRGAMLSVADSILRAWGWQAQSVDARRSTLRTDWLYFAGTEFTPRSGLHCDDAYAVVGLRFEIAPRQITRDSAEFVIRGEARTVGGRGRPDAERFARASFATIGAALRIGAHDADRWPDSLAVELRRLSGEVGMREGERAQGCVTVRP